MIQSKAVLNHIYNSTRLDTKDALVLGQAEEDMIAIGFTYEELEEIENKVSFKRVNPPDESLKIKTKCP